jgi:molybdate transport system regulatory protein
MKNPHLSIRLDLANGGRIGPGKIALLEAIRAKGSITAAAQHLGMAYRTAWLLVEQINEALREPAVITATGGQGGGGATVTAIGDRVIALYRAIEELTGTSAREEFQAISRLVRQGKRDRA